MTSGATDGDVLTWDDSAGKWNSAAPSGGGGGGSSLKVHGFSIPGSTITDNMNTGTPTAYTLTSDVTVNGGFTSTSTTVTGVGKVRIEFTATGACLSTSLRWAMGVQAYVDGTATGPYCVDYGRSNAGGVGTINGSVLVDCGTGASIEIRGERPDGSSSNVPDPTNPYIGGYLTITQLEA